MSTVRSLPFAKNPSRLPSGDQNWFDAPSVPESGRASSTASERTHRVVAFDVAATNAILVPSGETITLPRLDPIWNSVSGGGAMASSKLSPPDEGLPPRQEVAARNTAIAAQTAVAAIHPQGRARVATLADGRGAVIRADRPDWGRLLSSANRASPTSRNRCFGSFSRQCTSS